MRSRTRWRVGVNGGWRVSDDTRLAAEQGRLVSALAGGGELPSGFDVRGARALSAALLTKRRKAVSHAVPAIPRSLGAMFADSFDRYAAENPLPTSGDSVVDAIAFLRWLRRSDDLPRELRWLAGRLQWRRLVRAFA